MAGLALEGVFLYLLIEISGVSSDYQVNVLASGYNNLYNRCASCHNSSSQPLGCCNTPQLNSTLAAASCPALPDCEVSIVTCLGTTEMGNTTNIYDEATTEANFRSYGRREYISRLCGNQFHTSYVTTANYQTWESHMDLNGISPEYKGAQLLIIIFTNIVHVPVNLVDIVLVKIETPVGNQSSLTTYSGRYSIAEIKLSSRVTCQSGSHGSNCSLHHCHKFCASNATNCTLMQCCRREENNQTDPGSFSKMCSCDKEYLNVFCQSNNNICIGVDCGSGRCIADSDDTFHCKCNAGYKGLRCTDIIPNHKSTIIRITVGVIASVIVLGLAAIAYYFFQYIFMRLKKKRQEQREKEYFNFVEEDFDAS